MAFISQTLSLWPKSKAANRSAITVKVHLPHRLFIDWYGGKKGHGFEFHLLATELALMVFVNGAGAVSLDRSLYLHQIKKEITASQLLGEMK